MPLESTSTVAVFTANVALGTGLVLSVYRFMETRIGLGAIVGLLGVATIVAEANVGKVVYNLAYSELRALTIVAPISGVAGVTGATLTVKPTLNDT